MRWAGRVRRLVVLSGAGISTDSGIPDFRGPSGAWTLNPGAQHKHTYQAFLTDPELRGSYWKSRYEHPIWQAKPNAGHLAVAALASSDIDTTVVTQNTDGLHQQAGTPADRVIELHGTMHEVICVECGHRSPTADAIARIGAGEAVPQCLRCGGILKTASTMFGQTMSPEVFARAEQAVTTCDLVLAVGTTLTVEPAGSLCASAVGAGATLVIVNRDRTPYDGIATEIIRDPLSEALPGIAGHLLARANRSHTEPPSSAPGASSDSLRTPRPSQLLRAEARTARFRSRTAELERLTAWCAGTGVRTQLVFGPAGVGKSRLALELADRLAATGRWDVEFLAPDARLPVNRRRPLLAVVDDAETRQEQVAGILHAANIGPVAAPIRVLLLARTRDNWRDRLHSEINTSEGLAPPDNVRFGHADAVRDAADDYASTLTAAGFPCGPPNRVFLAGLMDAPDLPGALQASVLAGLLGLTGRAEDRLLRHELACLQRASDDHEVELPAEAVQGAVATAILCGAASENEALTALGHIPALRDDGVRIRTARWLAWTCTRLRVRAVTVLGRVASGSARRGADCRRCYPPVPMVMLMETTTSRTGGRYRLGTRGRHAPRAEGLPDRAAVRAARPFAVAVDVALGGGYRAPVLKG